MIRIGLTGGIASGKSQVGRYLARRGACVVDADRVAHETYAPGTEGFEALLHEFGPEILAADGSIDRSALGRLVFDKPERLAALTAIVWPLTRLRIEALQAEQKSRGREVFVVEAPLLFEAGWEDLFDMIWLVRSLREIVLTRLRERGLSDEDARARLAAATDPNVASAKADLTIENDGTLQDLESKVEAALAGLRSEG